MAFLASPTTHRVYRALAAEFWATFIFIFCITCSIINFRRLPEQQFVGNVIGALCVAYAGIVASACFGDVSGAHFNPAVTFAAVLSGKMPALLGLGYVVAQLAASCVVCLTLMMVYGGNNQILDQLLIVKPAALSYYKAFNVETFFSFIFITAIFMTAWMLKDSPFTVSIRYPKTGGKPQPAAATTAAISMSTAANSHVLKAFVQASKSKACYTPLVIGVTLAFLTAFGASVNPARAFGPAVVAWQWKGQWVPWAGCLVGSGCACLVNFVFFSDRFFVERPAGGPAEEF